MAKFKYTSPTGQTIIIEADDETSADAQFDKRVGQGEVPTKQKITSTVDNEPVDAMSAIFGHLNRGLRSVLPGSDVVEKKISPSLIKGVPGARHYVPQTEELSQFEEEHPITSKGLQVAGGITSTLPMAAGAAVRSGTGFIPQWAGQTAATTAINTGDLAAKHGLNIPDDELKHGIESAAATSLLPAALTKAVGQQQRYLPAMTPSEAKAFIKKYPAPESLGGYNFPQGYKVPVDGFKGHNPAIFGRVPLPRTEIPSMNKDTLDALLSTAGGLAGYHFLEGVPGAIAGGLGAHVATPLVKRAMDSTVGQSMQRGVRDPGTQDILRALMMQGRTQLTPPTYETGNM